MRIAMKIKETHIFGGIKFSLMEHEAQLDVPEENEMVEDSDEEKQSCRQ